MSAADTPAGSASVQYRLVVAKGDERVVGDDDAAVVMTVSPDALDDGAMVAYMRGKLKATGDTGAIIDLLASGAADAEFGDIPTP